MEVPDGTSAVCLRTVSHERAPVCLLLDIQHHFVAFIQSSRKSPSAAKFLNMIANPYLLYY